MQKKLLAILLSLVFVVTAISACANKADTASNATADTVQVQESAEQSNDNNTSSAAIQYSDDYVTINLNTTELEDGSYSHTATLDGNEVKEYDYTWHVDPAGTYDESKDAPAEYYTGEKPDDDDIYIAHDIYYYPEIAVSEFSKKNYDGEMEWVTYYQSDEYKDYIFGTLPVRGNDVPTDMMHSEEEAFDNAVLHIAKAGTYKLTGDWHGQINVDLGEDAFDDPDAKVYLILDNADINCTVAPGVIFTSVYESDHDWEENDTHTAQVNTADAGANIIIADGTENKISGTNIYRMLKAKYKDDESAEEVPAQKKIRKNDGALYSYMSMNINGGVDGTGVLNVYSENEGVDSELHLTINSGNLNIYSQDDGINTNEDNVSVTTINGGEVRIAAGLGFEGDGIDSNGYLVINGGTVVSLANPGADSGLDSSCGSYINGGKVLALGSTMDWAEADDSNDSDAVTINLRFASSKDANDPIEIKDKDGNVVFSFDLSDDSRLSKYIRNYTGAIISCPELTVGETYTIWVGDKQQCYTGTEVGGFGGGQMPPQMPDGEQPPQMKDGQQPPQMKDGQQPPEMPEGMTPPDNGDAKGRPEMKDGGQSPQMPDGQQPPQMKDGQQPPEMPEGMTPPDNWQSNDTNATPISDFLMEDKVNNFSGVKDL